MVIVDQSDASEGVGGLFPWMCALAFLSAYDLYVVLMNSKKASEDKHASFMLVPLCFKLNWHFGVLLSVGYLLKVIDTHGSEDFKVDCSERFAAPWKALVQSKQSYYANISSDTLLAEL